MTSRAERWAALLAEHNGRLIDWEPDLAEPLDRRYALVESSTRDSRRWITTHDSPAAAGSYWAGEEYREDWDPEYLLDLDTGAQLVPFVTVEWRAP